MALPQRSQPQLPPSRSTRSGSIQRRPSHQTRSTRNTLLEVGAMIGVNAFVSLIAIVTIIKLLPHNATQRQQLQSIETEVTALDRRVQNLRKEFVQYFDPQQTRINKRQLSDRLDAGQRKIILTEPELTSPSLEAGVEVKSEEDNSAEIDSEAASSNSIPAD